MKVIFEKKFKELIKNISSNIEITRYSIVTNHSSIDQLSDLMDIFYVNSDILRVEDELQSIWDEESKELRLSIIIKDSEKLLENKYCFIYCFYKSPGKEEKIAFILTGDFTIDDESGVCNFPELDLNSRKNLINVKFPKDSIANIYTKKDEDTEFLEGLGISRGINLFSIDTEIEIPEELVTKRSYQKYLRNYISSGPGLEFPYLNKNGEKILLEYLKFSKVTNLNIRTENSISSGGILIDNTLNPLGGEVNLLGTYTFTEYELIDDILTKTLEEERDLVSLNKYELVIVNDKGLKFTLDDNFVIKYEENKDPNNVTYADIQLKYYFFDPKTGELITTQSDILRLSQGEAEPDWVIDSDTPFMELDKRLYLFTEKKGEIQYFTINTNIELGEGDVKLELEEGLGDFFNITYEILENKTSSRVKIETVQENESEELWNPVIDGESKLLSCKVSIRTREEVFYCVQSPMIVDGIESYRKRLDNLEQIFEINFSNDNTSLEIYLKEVGENEKNYWELGFKDKRILLSSDSGELNSEDLWETGENLKSLVVYTEDKVEGIKNILYNPVLFCRVENEETDLSNWRDVLTLGKLCLPIQLIGDTPKLEIQESELILDRFGVYKFYVKSNCRFKVTIKSGETTLVSNRFGFFDTDKNELINSEFSLSNGVPVYIKTLIADYLGNDESNIELDTIYVETIDGSPKIEKTLRVFQKQLEPELSKVSPTERYLFLDDSQGSIKYRCNKSISIKNSNPELNITESVKLTKIDDVNRGYIFGELKLTYEDVINQYYPARYLGKLEILPAGYFKEGLFLDYLIFQKGEDPKITLNLDNNTVYLTYEKDNYIDITFHSVYNISEKDIEVRFPEGEDIAFLYNLYENGNNNYGIRIRAIEENTSLSNKYLGTITITSRINVVDFVNGGDISFTQEEVDNIAGVSIKEINLYQLSRDVKVPELVGDISDILPGGEFRIFNIKNPEGYDVIIVNPDTKVITEYVPQYNRIDATFLSILSNTDYKPIPLTEDYTKYSINRYVEFSVTMSDTTEDKVFVDWAKLKQLGYKEGILYSSKTNSGTILLGPNEKNKIYETINYIDNSIFLFVGLFGIETEIKPGDIGKRIFIEQVDDLLDNQGIIINQEPQWNGDFETSIGQIEIILPINEKNIDITRIFKVSVKDSMEEVHEAMIYVMQKKKIFELYTNLPSSPIPYHSSGYCIRYGNLDLGLLEDGLETNIPQEDIKIVSDNNEDFEYEVTFKEDGNRVDFNRYIITSKIGKNQNPVLVEDYIRIGYYDENLGQDNWLWVGRIAQGYSTVRLIDQKGIIIPFGETVGSLSNPYRVPSRGSGNSLKDRKLFKVNPVQNEVNNSGKLRGEVTIDKFNCRILDYIWTTDSGNASDIFDDFRTEYITSDNEYETPYIENFYITNSDFIRKKIGLGIIAELEIDCTDIGESIKDFDFIFYLEKVAGEDAYINPIPDNTTIDYKSQEILFSIDSNLVDFDILPEVSWITVSEIKGNNLKLYVSENKDESQSRTGKVKISGEDVIAYITVTQKPKKYIEVVESTRIIDKNGGDIEINVNTNVDYQTSTNVDWITINSELSTTNKIIINVEGDYNVEDQREGIITLRNSTENIEETVKIIQRGIPYLSIQETNLDFEETGGEKIVNISSNTDYSIS